MLFKSMVRFLPLIPFLWCLQVSGQDILSMENAVNLGIKNSAAFQAASEQVEQSRSLQKTAFNLPNPDLIAESPTGDFYAVGILQATEFPTVYFNQSKMLKQMTLASASRKVVSETEVRRLIKSLYVNLQYTAAVFSQFQAQDSLYSRIAQSAERQFTAGQIDYLAKTFAASQYGEIHNQFVQARTDYEVAMRQLQAYTGLDANIATMPYEKLVAVPDVLQLIPQTPADSLYYNASPTLQYFRQLQQVSYRSLSVQRSRALPGLVLGYLNQGPKETAPAFKFRVGIRVPLWFWQYGANIKSAKSELKISDLNIAAQKQQLNANMKQAVGNYSKFLQSLTYYEETGLARADDIIGTAMRLFRVGQTDYINYLRNTNDAYTIKFRYLETLRSYNQAVIDLNYLTGIN